MLPALTAYVDKIHLVHNVIAFKMQAALIAFADKIQLVNSATAH
jgi:hypothetical protein